MQPLSAVVWQLLACAKPCCYTWHACRYLLCCPAWHLVDCVCVSKCVCHLSNKELLYFTLPSPLSVYATDNTITISMHLMTNVQRHAPASFELHPIRRWQTMAQQGGYEVCINRSKNSDTEWYNVQPLEQFQFWKFGHLQTNSRNCDLCYIASTGPIFEN